MFFTDCEPNETDHANIKFIPFSLSKFNELASSKLGLNVKVISNYKLCDFKPAYGLIFGDYLNHYLFWGHGDVDLIFGNIGNFITQDTLDNYEVISPKKEYVLGHFTLYINSKKINTLFTRSIDYRRVFTSAEIFNFDECNFLWYHLLKGISIFKLSANITSMTHVVMDLDSKKYVKAYFKTHMIEQDEIDDAGQPLEFNENLVWDNGRLFNTESEKEYIYFHFHFLKKRKEFVIPQWQTVPAVFYISKCGFSEP